MVAVSKRIRSVFTTRASDGVIDQEEINRLKIDVVTFTLISKKIFRTVVTMAVSHRFFYNGFKYCVTGFEPHFR